MSSDGKQDVLTLAEWRATVEMPTQTLSWMPFVHFNIFIELEKHAIDQGLKLHRPRWHLTSTFNPGELWSWPTHIQKFQVQRSVDSKDRMEINGRIDGRTDGRTLPIALPFPLTRSVIISYVSYVAYRPNNVSIFIYHANICPRRWTHDIYSTLFTISGRKKTGNPHAYTCTHTHTYTHTHWTFHNK